jgi:hypothetical protein
VPDIRTRDEALETISRALAQWSSEAGDALTRAMTEASAALEAAKAEITYREQRVAALQAQLRELASADAHHAQALRAQIQHQLANAEQSLDTARRATRRIDQVAHQLARMQRSHAQTAESRVAGARADLTTRATALSDYRTARAGSLTAGIPFKVRGIADTTRISSTPAAALDAPTVTRIADWLGDCGLSEIDVDAAGAGCAGKPVAGSFSRGGHTRAYYRWALTTWDQVVRPGLDRGMSREDFAARDAGRDAVPPRRTVDVYDMVLGTALIRAERREDGTLNITDGQHLLAIAHELGITSLPAQVTSR